MSDGKLFDSAEIPGLPVGKRAARGLGQIDLEFAELRFAPLPLIDGGLQVLGMRLALWPVKFFPEAPSAFHPA